ncbi:hypothetical protein K501DRAFT_244085 [Backusella circina FSU 941]|nr:hypothetical protein K501DRAFT_244085 [Backusella circina FSU 941]
MSKGTDITQEPTPPSTIGNQSGTPAQARIRPTISLESVSLPKEAVAAEEKPSIYLFIFVNPLSGDKKGKDLVKLPMQHFRLRRFPQIQVEVHNILDEDDRNLGVKNIQLIESIVVTGEIPPNPKNPPATTLSSQSEQIGRLSNAVQSKHIQVWSAGGDGTVMSVFELLVSHKINLDLVFFSCIPFGTGNDFSQFLGWGRTIPEKNILGSQLHNLEQLITDRLEKSEAARLDIWQVKMTAYQGGYVRQAGPKERKDGHDVAEVKEPQSNQETELIRKMSNYTSIGVQGYVGSGFEAHRAGNRLLNMLMYAYESSKWIFWRKFPDINQFIESITQNNRIVLYCPLPDERDARVNQEDIPEMEKDPIDFVIQNIPHIWGREANLWGEAKTGLESVKNRSGPTDPSTWKPQRANDMRLEVMTIENMKSYLKKLASFHDHVSRLGQFDSPFEINFRDPAAHERELEKVKTESSWKKTRAAIKDRFRHKYEKNNIICIMCDGEFYEIKDPKSIEFNQFTQIRTLGRNDDETQGRIVVDELESRVDGDIR